MGNIDHCNFDNVTLDLRNAILFNDNGTITNCQFTNFLLSASELEGPNITSGFVAIKGSGTIINSTFSRMETYCSNVEGFILHFGGDSVVRDCTFSNYGVSKWRDNQIFRGTIYGAAALEISNCTMKDATITSSTCLEINLLIQAVDVTITDSTFSNIYVFPWIRTVNASASLIHFHSGSIDGCTFEYINETVQKQMPEIEGTKFATVSSTGNSNKQLHFYQHPLSGSEQSNTRRDPGYPIWFSHKLLFQQLFGFFHHE